MICRFTSCARASSAEKDQDATADAPLLSNSDWKIINSTFPAEKTAAFAARFNVPVAQDGEATLNYRVRVKY